MYTKTKGDFILSFFWPYYIFGKKIIPVKFLVCIFFYAEFEFVPTNVHTTAQWCVFNNSSLIGIKICQILTHKTKL